MKRRPDWFLPGMVLAVLLAWLFPSPGAQGGWLHPEILNKAGIALIFFLHGLTLSFAALKAGTLRWPLHLVVQATTFVVFPLLGLLGLWLARAGSGSGLGMGFFYLCALPSTVSSSVVLTAAAKGNVPAAVFNATLSSVLGVVVTPLWVGWVMRTGGHPLPLGGVIVDLCLWLVLPLVLGQLARPWLGAWARGHMRGIHGVDRATILLLVYTSFCDSMRWGVWSGKGGVTVFGTLLGCLVLFAVVMAATTGVCRLLGFPTADRITAVFCGSKKTLASGVPMARLIFGADPGLALILLPIMVYHPMQLVLCGWLAGRWGRRQGANDE